MKGTDVNRPLQMSNSRAYEKGAGGGHVPPHFLKWGGAHKWDCAPHFWVEQMF